MNVSITRPNKNDFEEMHLFFQSVITDTFLKEGINLSYKDEIRDEVEKQLTFLSLDFQSDGTVEHFLIAKINNQIVGTIAVGQANTMINTHYKIDLHNIPEIKSVYVLPAYQGKGIGTKLFNEVIALLLRRGINEICLDSGYKRAQIYWIKKLGQPIVKLKDFWGKDLDYMIWHTKIDDILA